MCLTHMCLADLRQKNTALMNPAVATIRLPELQKRQTERVGSKTKWLQNGMCTDMSSKSSAQILVTSLTSHKTVYYS